MTVMSPGPSSVGIPVMGKLSLRHALPSGSRVLSARGEVLIETLTPDDRVITRDRGMMPVRDVLRLTMPRGAPMVLIPAGAMGRGRPERDVTLPPDQPVVLRDWRARTIFNAREARVAAARLTDGSVIRPVTSSGGTVWCILLDRPSAVYVDGLELVSGALDAMTP